MRARIVVREEESLEHALKRLQREVSKDRAFDKWPKWQGCYVKPSAIRNRKRWIKALRLKWQRIQQRVHEKQLAKYHSQ